VVGNGSIAPSTPQSVAAGTTLMFTLTPGVGQHVDSTSGCPGSFSAPVYTTAPLVANCTLTATFEPDRFTIGGTVNGLGGSGFGLSLNGGAALAVPANATSFAFPDTLPYGSSYAVTIATQPANQVCTISDGSGTVEAQVTDIAVSCGPDANDIIFRNGFDPSTP
jgi:hypothetical protein